MSSERFYSLSGDGSQRGEGVPESRVPKPKKAVAAAAAAAAAATKRGVPLTLPSRGDGLKLRTASLNNDQKSILAEFDALVQGEKELLDREKKVLGSGDLRALKKMPAGGVPLLRLTNGVRSDAAPPARRRGHSHNREPAWAVERFAGNVVAAILASTHVVLMQLQYPVLALA